MSTLVPVSGLKIAAIGEVLWDVYGQERYLGGAPFNFIYHCHALGADARIITRVGKDELGREIFWRAGNLGIPAELIQTDPVHPTGTVQVTLDSKGSPAFDICGNAAWDFIELPLETRAAIDRADVLCFGTLAQRSPVSRKSIMDAIAGANPAALCVMDLNLRQSFYSEEVIRASLAHTDVLKLNDDEFVVLQKMLGLSGDIEAAVQELITGHLVAHVVVTRGAQGARAWSLSECADVPGLTVPVKDTVGSGDAFTAVFAMQLAAGASLKEALEAANAAGAYVATQPGATPPMNAESFSSLN